MRIADNFNDNRNTVKRNKIEFVLKFLDCVSDALIVIDKQNEIILLNKQAINILGYKQNEIIGKNINVLLPSNPFNNESTIINDETNCNNPLCKSKEWHQTLAINKSGKTFTVLSMQNKIETDEENIFVITIKENADNSNLQNIESKLHETEGFGKNVVDSLLSHVAVLDKNGNIISTNKAWKEYSVNNANLPLPRLETGSNLFEACRNSSNKWKAISSEALESMLAVLNNKKNFVELQYSFLLNNEENYFLLRIMKFSDNSPKIVLVHYNISEIKHAEHKIAENKNKYESLLATTDEMIFTVSLDKRILWANNAWKKSLLYNEEDIKCLKITDFLSAETKIGFQERFEKYSSGEIVENHHVIYIAKNGNPVYAVGTIVPYFEDGKFLGTQAFFRNITDKVELDEKIIKQQKQLINAENITHFGSWEYDAKNEVTTWSDGVYHILEIKKKDIEPTFETFLEFVHPEDKEFVIREYITSRDNRIAYNIIHRVVLKNGKTKYLHGEGENSFNEQGELISSCGTIHDITDWKNSQQLLQQNEKKFQKVIEKINDGLIINNAEGKIIFWNKKFLDIFGLADSDMESITLEKLVNPEYKKMVMNLHKQRFAGKDINDSYEFKGNSKDGAERWYEVCATNNIEGGIVVSVQKVIRDITEQREAKIQLEFQNAELRKINTELDKFVYSTSHDLRAPLMSVSGLIELCRDSDDKHEIHEFYKLIEKSITRLDDTIKDILMYSRNSRTELHIEQLNIEEMYYNHLERISLYNNTKNITFSSTFHAGIPFFSDSQRVSTIINNLLTNAIKYQRENEPNKNIKFSFSSTHQEGIIIVEDNGEGIEEDKIEKVFEMFYRNSIKSDSAGLGLYICKEIVNKMDGEIVVKSELGKGTIFTVCLPNEKQSI